MLTQHVYWYVVARAYFMSLQFLMFCRNLDAFQGSDDILNHSLWVDGEKVVALDSNAIPTGKFIDVRGTAYDFESPHTLGARWNDTAGFCGDGGYP